jgi:hypothetical protein
MSQVHWHTTLHILASGSRRFEGWWYLPLHVQTVQVEGGTNLQNVRNHSPNETASYSKRRFLKIMHFAYSVHATLSELLVMQRDKSAGDVSFRPRSLEGFNIISVFVHEKSR